MHAHRRGFTITELLIVIMIAVILIAAALPAFKRVMDDSRTRDGARIVAGHLAMARTHAARTNRPYGVELVLEPPVGYVDPPQPAPPAAPLPVPSRLVEGIRMTDLAFTYPGTDRPVLAGVDLDIPAGSIVAIVPYFGYARQDRKAKPRTPITAVASTHSSSPGSITAAVAGRSSTTSIE